MPNLTPRGLTKLLEKQAREISKAAKRGALSAATRGAAKLQKKVPRDTGDLARSFRVGHTSTGAQIRIDAPHAGIVERGARPHRVNAEGREALAGWVAGWVRRRLKITDEAEINAVVAGICRKLEREGQKPTWFVRNYRTEAARVLREEVDAEIKNLLEGR
jgi:hypothetical protein